MRRFSSRFTSGRRRTPRTTLKMAALAPIPSARVRTTVMARPLVWARERRATFRSRRSRSRLNIGVRPPCQMGLPEMRLGQPAFGATKIAGFYTTSVEFAYPQGTEAREVPCDWLIRDELSVSWGAKGVSVGSGLVEFGIGVLRRRTGWWVITQG